MLYRQYNAKKKANILLEKQNIEIQQKNEEITVQRDEIAAQRDLVTKQKDHIEEQKKEIEDSIQYAQRIQAAILPSDEIFSEIIAEYFLIYRPKDVVAGDFYFGAKVNDRLVIAIDMKTKKMQYSGANNSIYILPANIPVNKSEITVFTELTPDKMPVAIHVRMDPFGTQEYDLQPGDQVYLFTDGLPDQFGGPKGKKFKYKQFKEILLANAGLSMKEQGDAMEEKLMEWLSYTDPYTGHEFEQTDDITVMGIRM